MNALHRIVAGRSSFRLLFGLLSLAVGLAAPLEARSPHARQGNAAAIQATIWGHFDYAQMAWVGHALVTINDGSAAAATFVDRSIMEPVWRDDGSFEGAEIITFTFADGSQLEVAGEFEAVPEGLPLLFMLHETGKLQNGTGTYAGVSGRVSVRGPFLFPFPPMVPPAKALWIAEMHGTIRGLASK